MSGSATLSIHEAVATGFDLAAAAAALHAADPVQITGAVRAALAAGTTPFTAWVMPIKASRGVLTLESEATAASGTASLAGSLDLLSGTLEGRLALHPGADSPELVERLTGSAANLVRTPELAGLARWLADRS